MPSERIQRRIDRLLDTAEEAADRKDWPAAAEAAREALSLDAENDDAKALLGAAESMLPGARQLPASGDRAAAAERSEAAVTPLPASFAAGRYRVQRFLGEGGRKRVYLAHDTRLDRDVALAVIKTEGLDMAGLARVRNEAQAMARLGDHPNIVTVFDVLEEAAPGPRSRDFPALASAVPYIVSQYMAGGSVEDLIAKAEDHRLPTDEVLSIATQVCAALDHAHRQGIVHRDVKPGNVWLAGEPTRDVGGPLQPPAGGSGGDGRTAARPSSPSGRDAGASSGASAASQSRASSGFVPSSASGRALREPPDERAGARPPTSPRAEAARASSLPTAKLGDFGLAVALDRSRVTMAGMMLGTVAYMPPEQALGGESTPKADLYSLGCMLYEMVTGRPPFLGEDPTAVISQHINTPPVAPSWLTERCPPDLEAVILHLLAKSPDTRPESAAEVRAALAKVDPAQKSASHSDSTENPLDRLARGVFVGRQAELEKLRKAFDEAFAGHGSLVMLVGEPGIGKTRTAQELETYARMRGAQVLWGRTHETGGAPAYWPWYQVGNAYAAANDIAAIGPQLPPGANGELSRIFTWLRQQPNFVEPEPITDPESAQFRLFEAYAAFIRAMATQTPLLIALDDLHWADKPSLLLLQHLGRELSRLRVLIVGNYRDTDLSRTHPLSEALAGLNRDPGFARVVLRGLSRAEVANYIRAAANVEPGREVLDRIYEETEGNAFFLSEVVNLMAQEGTLTKESVSEIRIPDGVREALGRRLNRLSEEANELLQVAAIIGREFTYDMLTLLGDRDEEALLKLIEQALDGRVIEEMGQAGRYRFTHAQMQETLLEELSTTRRVRLHGRVAEALEKRWGEQLARERAPRLAHHFVEASMLSPRHAQKGVLYSKLAAEESEARSAWDEAARHYESCLTLITASQEALGEDEAALLVELGRCLRYANQIRPAWRSLMRATTIYRARGDGAGMARAALEASEILPPRDRLVALCEEALNALGESDLRLRARLLLMRAGWEFDDASKAAAAEAARIANTLDDPALLGRLVAREAWEAFGEKQLDEGVSLFRRAHALLDDGGDRQGAASSLFWVAAWILFEGKLDEGIAATQDDLAYGRKFRFYELNCLAYLQAAALIRCDFQQFDAILNEVTGDHHWIPMLRAARAEMAGDTDAALKLAPTPDTPGGTAEVLLAQLLGSLARTRFNAGHEDEARKYVAECSKQLGQVMLAPNSAAFITARHEFRIYAIAELDECLPALGDESLIQALYEELVEWKILRYSPADARGLDHIRGALALRLERIDEAEAWYRTGLEWSEREGCPVEAGRCLHGLAEVAERRGQTREALQHLDRAIALFQQHGARLYLDRALALKLRLQGVSSASFKTSIEAVTESVQAERPALPDWTSAPEGTVTILFSDIEDSTVLTERLGDQAWMALLQKHNDLIRTQLRAHGGFEVKTIGDGFMVAFQSARRALECAIEIQRAMASLEAPVLREPQDGQADAPSVHPEFIEGRGASENTIKVRIGLHAGEAIKDKDDFYGRNVILASRIGGIATGGQVLVSSTLRDLVQGAGFRFDDGRDVELKGLTGKQRIYEVAWGT